jgi:hypothetical protein
MTACNVSEKFSGIEHQYSLFETSSGKVILLNIATGETKEILKEDKTREQTKESNRQKLEVGEFYITENGDVMKYIGNGKLIERPSLDEFLEEK